jgi:hypothetical protein
VGVVDVHALQNCVPHDENIDQCVGVQIVPIKSISVTAGPKPHKFQHEDVDFCVDRPVKLSHLQ